MVRSNAIEIIARHLSLNAGRLAALAQRAAEAGELPRACGRAVPDLSPAGLAKLLLCAIADRGLGNAATSVREFAALRNEGGTTLLDLIEGLMSGAVSVAGVHSLIAQLDPAAVTVVTDGGRLSYGPEREQSAASRIITVPGAALRAIIAEFRGNALHPAPPLASVAARISATAHTKAA
ncbi:hypothetical protein GGQ85_002644 [Nitrobacter vulgaris]|uniref:hypothetical protein n=1 Tax=Nitrobacter vulgaris TaxID=29421 RepID=UPI00285FD60F|nr:hypothetical protein [Nitrobacter vulgaris]MDR6304928.1 hypothetical protein [Nitrobacter vulgaris]